MKDDIISIFAKHRVAANVLMCLLLIFGFSGLKNLNTQFLPNFELDIITVTVVWPGATAEDIERAITIPLEQELKIVSNLNEMTSTSSESVSAIVLEFKEGTDMGLALDEVKEKVDLVRNLPANSEEPEVSRAVRYENVAKVILTSNATLESLRPLAYEIKRDLLARGIAKVDIEGLPEKEIAIKVASQSLFELNLTLPEIAQKISALSQDLPAGTAGRDELGVNIRSTGQKRENIGFENLNISLNEDNRPIKLSEFATITQRPQKDEVEVFINEQSGIILKLLRTETSDSLEAANILSEWKVGAKERYGDSIDIIVYDESWKLIEERISLLLYNGLSGLILIVIILFALLERRIAFWVAAGVPVSIIAAMGVLYLFGGSINMVSLFAIIMTLGIIVDDTIVVGENAYTRIQQGETALQAVINAAKTMFAPVMASSLTTLSAFLPLMIISGVIGNILFDIPFVVICVIIASIIECFLILPGHIYHSFRREKLTASKDIKSHQTSKKFIQWRDTTFKNFVHWNLENRLTSLSVAIGVFMIVLSIPLTGRVGFEFFPSPEGQIISADIQFISGTPREKIEDFVNEMNQALDKTVNYFETQNNEKVLEHAVIFINKGADTQSGSARGNHLASIVLEMVTPDKRDTRNTEFIQKWRENIKEPAGLEKISIFAQRGGPPGKDIDIDLIGPNTLQLKQAAIELQQSIRQFPGTFNVQDDLPYGKPQLIYELTTQGEDLGLSIESLGSQLRAAFDGSLFQVFNEEEDEIEVRVILTDQERDNLSTLQYFPIKTPQGTMTPLNTVANFKFNQGLETLKHADGLLATRVSAEVDTAVGNSADIIANLEVDVLPKIMRDYGIQYELKGRSEDQAETFEDMGTGVIIALLLIYFILAWVFSSYTTPLVVISIIPFGLIGAIFGHWLLGIELTILSFFGFFGLSGIVVNDSIILIVFYRELRRQGVKLKDAVTEASAQRIRAVLLTSLTTIAGLTPLMFETSLQAQFLIPMAVSITFGLAFATLVVLILVPILLYTQKEINIRLRWMMRSS